MRKIALSGIVLIARITSAKSCGRARIADRRSAEILPAIASNTSWILSKLVGELEQGLLARRGHIAALDARQVGRGHAAPRRNLPQRECGIDRETILPELPHMLAEARAKQLWIVVLHVAYIDNT